MSIRLISNPPIALKHAHQQLAEMLANGRVPSVLSCRASRIEAECHWQASMGQAHMRVSSSYADTVLGNMLKNVRKDHMQGYC